MAKFVLFRHGESAPTLLTCVECGSKVKKKEVIFGRAREIGEKTCVCPECRHTLEEAESRNLEEGFPSVARDENFISYVHVATSDETVRETVLSIVRLNVEERNRVIENLLVSLAAGGAPEELISFFETLKDEAISRRVRDLIGSAR